MLNVGKWVSYNLNAAISRNYCCRWNKRWILVVNHRENTFNSWKPVISSLRISWGRRCSSCVMHWFKRRRSKTNLTLVSMVIIMVCRAIGSTGRGKGETWKVCWAEPNFIIIGETELVRVVVDAWKSITCFWKFSGSFEWCGVNILSYLYVYVSFCHL